MNKPLTLKDRETRKSCVLGTTINDASFFQSRVYHTLIGGIHDYSIYNNTLEKTAQ